MLITSILNAFGHFKKLQNFKGGVPKAIVANGVFGRSPSLRRFL